MINQENGALGLRRGKRIACIVFDGFIDYNTKLYGFYIVAEC